MGFAEFQSLNLKRLGKWSALASNATLCLHSTTLNVIGSRLSRRRSGTNELEYDTATTLWLEWAMWLEDGSPCLPSHPDWPFLPKSGILELALTWTAHLSKMGTFSLALSSSGERSAKLAILFLASGDFVTAVLSWALLCDIVAKTFAGRPLSPGQKFCLA